MEAIQAALASGTDAELLSTLEDAEFEVCIQSRSSGRRLICARVC